jgi:hypothetical protein
VKAIPNKDWFLPIELATAIDEPVLKVFRWMREGRVKYVRFGRRAKIPKAELERILAHGIDCRCPVHECKPVKAGDSV